MFHLQNMLNSTRLLAEGFTATLTSSLGMICVFLAPFLIFAVIIHFFEAITQRRLAERFGWNVVLWTGWLGAPIHELSHAAMCVLFRHRIDEVALFEPDRESGRLGFVRHSYRRGNWFEEVGNLFIGIAPLLGGAIVLALMLWLFYPEAASAGVEASKPLESGESFVEQTWRVATTIGEQILAWQNFGTARFWIFLYLVLCVGSHMAPSRSDYDGASRGIMLAGGLLLGTTVLLAAVGVDLKPVLQVFVDATGPLIAILGLTVMLVGLATVAVVLLTIPFREKYRVG